MEFVEEIERLKELIVEKSFRYGYFTLSSGQESLYYFDGRLTTLSPEGAFLVGSRVFSLVREAGVDAVGGPTLGADPIVAAVALISYQEGCPVPAFIVRKEPKKHGTQRYIEGNFPEEGTVAIVDDVITSGGSILRAIEVVEAAGLQVGRVIALVDRNQGGSDELRRRGYSFTSLFSADEDGHVSISL